MAEGLRPKPIANGVLVVAGIVIIVAGIRAASSILVPFMMAAFLALIAAPPLYWLMRRGFSSGVAVLLVVAGMAAAGLVLGTLLGTSLNDFTQAVPEYQSRLRDQMTALLGWLRGLGVQIPDQALVDYLDPGAAMRLVGRTLSGLGGILTNAFMIFLTVIFILLEASSFPAKLRAVLVDPEASFTRFGAITSNVNRYIAIKTTISAATGLIAALWVGLLGVDFPLLWGLLAFMLNFVPNLGSIIAAVPPVLLAVVQFGVGRALLVAAGYAVVNVVMGNVIEPRFMGRRLGLSTLVVFLSLVFWGWVFGPVGMLLSVPLTMTAKIALESNAETRWISIFLGSEGTDAGSDELT
jgi:predicted PurR-regulated permease PerM